ncbi:transposase, partial [Siccirubricoccus sp. KC 17139]
GPGRPIPELRQRMDAIFHLACSAEPWRALPPAFGKPDTVSRCFRRLTHAGLWQRLLRALVDLSETHTLRAIEAWITRACRRAARILGLGFIVLIRRLGLLSALNGPPWLLPDPEWAESLARSIPVPAAPSPAGFRRLCQGLRLLRRLHRIAVGRRRIPRCLRLAWA